MTAHWKPMLDFMKSRGSIDNIMVVSSEDGAFWASSDEANFYLRKYSATITQEDGTDKEEEVNEAVNIVKYMKGQTVSQGLRINGLKKQQITRSFKDEVTNLPTIFSKFPQGGSCVANGGKCILIATYDEIKGHNSPDCNETVTLIARYLVNSSWPSASEPDQKTACDSAVSWQSYVDKLLVGRGNVAQALICSAVDGKILASTEDFKFLVYDAEIPQEDGSDQLQSVDEAKNVLKLMQKSKPSQGLRVSKTKYQVIRSFEEENSKCHAVYGKKTMGGCAIFHCGAVLLVGTYDEAKGHTSPACCAVLIDVAKHLKERK